MKFLLLTLIVLSAGLLPAQDGANRLEGTWKASVRGDYYYYRFGPDSSMQIIHGTDTTLCRFKQDTTAGRDGIHTMDVYFLDRMDGHVLYMSPSIFEWMSADRIRFRMSENMRDRPVSFLPKGNMDTLILVRQKQN